MRFNHRYVAALVLLTVVAVPVRLWAEHFAVMGVDSVSAQWFDTWYHQGNLVNYLDNYNNFTIYQSETTGRWDRPDRLMFSVQGNSHKWNKYYINGFRIDQRFTAGSTVYRPNMMLHSLSIDTYQSELRFTPVYQSDSSMSVGRPMVAASFNMGGIGGISPGTNALINTFHHSAVERMLYPESGLDPRKYRNHIVGTGEIEGLFGIKGADTKYYQHLYANYGRRKITALNETGIYGFYPDDYWCVQADGRLPLGAADSIVSLHYMLNISHRDAMGAEYNLNPEEVMQNNNYSVSAYLKNNTRGPLQWTVGLTWASNTHRHKNMSFVRNLVDQDGEAFEPWMPDGVTTEADLSVNVQQQLLPWLRLHYEGYNSMVAVAPDTKTWSNKVIWRSMHGNEQQDLYTISWASAPFSAGILDNKIGLTADYAPVRWFSLRAGVDATLDGILLGKGKSIVTPNYQAQLSLRLHPADWFEMGLNIGNYNIPYGIDEIRFFSADYLNGAVRYADGTLFATTGGAYHSRKRGLWQQQYAMVDIPICFRFGKERRHELSILSSYKKFYRLWTTRYQGGADLYGYYVNPQIAMQGQVFMFNGGEQRYVVDYQRADEMGTSFFNNSAWWASNMIKYAYNGKKVFVSLSWQSFMGVGIAAMGNGALSNNVGMLSESQANPNMTIVTTNITGSTFKQEGRIDQDKAYVARLMVAYNITDEWRIGLNFKFTDGQPFSNFSYQFETDAAGHTQVAIWNSTSKGINPRDNDFGRRKDSFFNLDMNVSYRGYYDYSQRAASEKVKSAAKRWEIQLYGYNLYDFGTELSEFTFHENNSTGGRNAMTLCIPRGLMLNLKFEI